jgi:hypothetical protein
MIQVTHQENGRISTVEATAWRFVHEALVKTKLFKIVHDKAVYSF